MKPWAPLNMLAMFATFEAPPLANGQVKIKAPLNKLVMFVTFEAPQWPMGWLRSGRR